MGNLNKHIKIIVIFVTFFFLLGLFHEFFMHDEAHCKENCYLCKIVCIGFEELNSIYANDNLFPYSNPASFIFPDNTKVKNLLVFRHLYNRAPPLLTFFSA